MLGTILLIVLILMLVGAFPTWPHSRSWAITRAADWACWWLFWLPCCCWAEFEQTVNCLLKQ